MRKRLIALCGISAVVMMGAGGAAYAAASSGTAVQPPEGVYACVNATGQINYLEFREPIPHACEYGDNLWQLNVGNDVVPTVTVTSDAQRFAVANGVLVQQFTLSNFPAGTHVVGGVTAVSGPTHIPVTASRSGNVVTVTFATAPGSGTTTVSISYNYEN